MKNDITSSTSGVLIGQVVSVLMNYDDPRARELQYDLLAHYQTSGNYFAQGLGLYVDNLYALGENPLDEKWDLKISDTVSLSVAEAYKALIHPNSTRSAFYNRLKASDVIGQSTESISNTNWSLIGLTALTEEKSIIEDAKQQFANIEFDFSPKAIDVTNIKQPYVLAGTTIKPVFNVTDQYGAQRSAVINLQSSNPSVLQVNEKNELIALKTGEAVVTASVEGFENVRTVLTFRVTDSVELAAILPNIERGMGHLLVADPSTFEDATALNVLGYAKDKIKINLYSTGMNAYNDARNILSLVAAGHDPSMYNAINYVDRLNESIAAEEMISSEHAATILLAQYVVAEPLADKVVASLLTDLVEVDSKMYIETFGEPDISRTAKILQTVAILNKEALVTAPEFVAAEEKMYALFKENYSTGTFAEDAERQAVAVLNYMAIKGELEGFDALQLAEIILKNQRQNEYITNGHIQNLSGLASESTGIGLNAISYLLTGKNAYMQLQNKEYAKPTTITLQVTDKAKVNMPLELQGDLLDQNGNVIESPITWIVNGEEVTSYTPTEVGTIQLRAEAQGIFAEKPIEVIDYQKVFNITIEPPQNVMTDQAIALNAVIKDSEGTIVEDEAITWGVEPLENVQLNGSVVKFTKPGQYVVTAEAGGVKARALEVNVELNSESIQTQVGLAVEKMMQYLENKGQYDYISALAYSNVVNDASKSQEQMRTIGHLREYGNHDNKYSLYYAKNILQAAAAGENPRQFKTYKGPVVDLVTPLVNAQDEDGHFTMFINFDKTSVATQAWSIIALDLINEPYNRELAVKDLLKGLNSAMSEGSYSELEMRALALTALSNHRDIEGVEEQIASNLNYIRNQQNETAGFNYGGYTNNPFAIGTIIQGLIAVGENPYDAKWKKNGKTMVEALLSQQIANGGFKFGDEFEPDVEFDEFKSTEAAFGALADLHTKVSIFNKNAQLVDKLPELTENVKPYIEIEELVVQADQPLLTVSVKAFDNIDGELTPTVTLNDKPVYAVASTYKAVVAQGVNYLKVATTNSAGNEAVETIPVLFQNEQAEAVPQATVKVAGVNGAEMYANEAIIEDGDTAYSVLVKAIGKQNIVSRPFKEGVYIVSINGLAEFDHGNESGWMYRVNGGFPETFASAVELQDGDVLEWVYTTDLGKDVGYNDYTKPEVPATPEVVPTEPAPVIPGAPSPNPVTPEVPVTKPETKPAQKPSTGGGSGGGSGGSSSSSKPATTNDSSEDITVSKTEEETTVEITKGEATEKPVITVNTEEGVQFEIPSSAVNALNLQENEKVAVQVKPQLEKGEIDVQLQVVKGESEVAFTTKKGYVTVTIPAENIAATSVVLQLVDGEYRAVPHRIVDRKIELKVKSSGTFIVTDEVVTFKDITNSGFKNDIEFLASRHVIKGKNAETFAPNDKVTRAQFAALVSRALGLQANEESKFTDTKGKWYESDVQALFEAGITTGKTETTFDPGANMTREQGAVFMARILDYVGYDAPPAKTLTFKDEATINDDYKAQIALLVELGIMSGKEDGSFDAKGHLTRGQLAKMLTRTLQIAELM